MKSESGGDRMPGKLEMQMVANLRPAATMKEDFVQACGENPLVHGAMPILGCDVREHSYYIDYRKRRPDYLKAFLDHLVNWEYVAEMFATAVK